jgi:hypothetical protein
MAFAVDLDADGSSVDTVLGNSGVANSFVTVATTLGTITTADALAGVPGIQVATNASGDFTFNIRRPGGPGTPTISVQTIDGTGSLDPGVGNNIIDYVSQMLGAAEALQFDFDDDFDGAVPQTETGYTSVPVRLVYDNSIGYGWTGANADRDKHSSGSLPSVPFDDLLRDSQGYTSARTFRADVADGTYRVTVTLTAGNNVSINDAADGGANLVSGLDTSTGAIVRTFTYVAADDDGVQLTFENPGPHGSLWKVAGLVIRPSQDSLTVGYVSGSTNSDGVSVSTWQVSGLTVGNVYTLTPSAGAIQTADGHAIYAGTQIVAAGGSENFTLIAPTAPGNVTVTVEEVNGATVGTSAPQAFTMPSPWLFDFDGPRLATLTGGEVVGSPTITSVTEHLTFASTGGYGWSTVNGRGDFDSGELVGVTALREDGVFINGQSTFQVATGSVGTFDVRIYTAEGRNPPVGLEVFIEGVSQGVTTLTTASQTLLFDNLGAGFGISADGVLDIRMVTTGSFAPAFISGIEVATNGGFAAPQALHAVAVGSGGDALTQSELDAAVAGALGRVAVEGASQQTLDVLAGVTVTIADLSGTHLGLAYQATNTIVIDLDAAGHGWFVDDTPLDDTEFTLTTAEHTLSATSTSPASSRMDLLTTLLHEFGHILGHGHTDEGLLSESLEPGTRHTDVDNVFSNHNLFEDLN